MANAMIVYGSSTGVTEGIARKIGDALGDAELVEASQLSESNAASFDDYSLVVLGASTWGIGDLQDDFHAKLGVIEGAALSGVKVAVFGTGDQESYADSFVDGIGILAEAAEKAGATLVGKTSTEGYTFEESRAVRDGQFLGLAIDEDNQGDLTDQRIAAWVKALQE